MNEISNDLLERVCGGISEISDYMLRKEVAENVALNYAGDDHKLSVGEMRKFIGVVQTNGLYGYERDAIRWVSRNVEMTDPARRELNRFFNAVD